jgi:type IV pilus assembly protein PilC
MAQKLLESSALSTFCGSIATMISAGIQNEEAALMLAENRERSRFQEVCSLVYTSLEQGDTFAEAMEKSGGFPRYAIDMVATGEKSGHLEQVMRNLEVYYDEEDRLFAKLRSSVGYPAALLIIMSIILAFTVTVILPVFSDVYANMAGSLASGSFTSVGLSVTIGWVALIVMIVCAIISLLFVLETRNERGRQRVMALLGRIPQTKQAMYQLALSRFTVALSTLVSSGITDEEAMARAIETVDHPKLKTKTARAARSMADLQNPHSLIQAITEYNVFDPLYARMLNVGMRSGTADETLAQLSQTFFDDAVVQTDESIDRIEPVLAAFLTASIGATLIAVMLPLVGIMGSIG